MICHAHLTLKDLSLPTPKGWKRTEILLTNGSREDHDVMLTRHFKSDLTKVMEEIAKIRGVERVKIERTRTWQEVDREHYAEFHVKVPEGATAPTASGWARSRNPRDRGNDGRLRYFFNKRVYSGKMEEIIEEVKRELYGIDYVELKIEQNIFDSNRSHDAWWA